MSIDGDAAAQLIDAGLVAADIDHQGSGGQHFEPFCANCGTTLLGRFCQNCGQRGEIHRSLPHLVEEFFHGLFHFDGKIWRTLPLLLARPGALTRRFVQGQRVRFVSPIALFFFTIFLMFFTLAQTDPAGRITQRLSRSPDAQSQVKEGLTEAKSELTEAESDAAKGDSGRESAELRAADSAIERAQAAEGGKQDDGLRFDAQGLKVDGIDWRGWSRRLAERKDIKFLDNPVLVEHIRASLRDPDLLLYKLKNVASEYSFLLVPLSLPFLWLAFLFRRGVYLFDHVVFLLHSLSFMALFVCLCALAFRFDIESRLQGWPLLLPPLHLFFHLRGAYQLGIFAALWRSLYLLMVAMLTLGLYVTVILLLGVLD